MGADDAVHAVHARWRAIMTALQHPWAETLVAVAQSLREVRRDSMLLLRSRQILHFRVERPS